MTTIGEAISRVRNLLKAVNQDAFVTDRFIYSLIMKHGRMLMRRQDNLNRIMKFNSIFQPLQFVELIDVDSAESQCKCVFTGCEIKRTKNKLPDIMQGYYGPLIRSVSSLDYSEEVYQTQPTIFEKVSKQKNFKYNKTKYYWYLDGYLYFPNLDWDAVRMEVVPEGDISSYNCDNTDDCIYKQNKKICIPDFLFAEIDQLIFKDFGLTLQIPPDPNNDNKNILR